MGQVALLSRVGTPLLLSLPASSIDQQIDDTVREDAALIDKSNRTIGFTYPCPRCSSRNASFVSGTIKSDLVEDDWVCHNCGLIFDYWEAQTFIDLNNNDKERREEW